MEPWTIRPAVKADFGPVMEIYALARQFMRENGNPSQWGDHFPPAELIRADIEAGWLYVLEECGVLHGVFALIDGPDPSYAVIEGGSWLSPSPYAVIHRVAGDGRVGGVFRRCLAFCRERRLHLRIDTHRDNKVMQHLIETSGFQKCGVIHVADGSPRIAYEYLQP